MLVSVVLPVYDGLPFLPGAVESILAQDIDFELVISDDHSRDKSADFIRNIDDPRVSFLPNETNAGIFGNLNRCIAAASGRFIQVFSQDDLMCPGFLESQIARLEAHPDAGLVYGIPFYIDEAGAQISTTIQDETPEIIDRDLYIWIASHYASLPPSISSVMFPRSVFEAVGPFNTAFRVAGDIEYYNRIAERFILLRNAEKLHKVRSHSRAASALRSAGPAYLDEEIALQGWYRRWWSDTDYKKILRFRSCTRGGYHLGWIKQKALAGDLPEAVAAVWRLHSLYPLQWLIWWRISSLFRNSTPKPLIAAPRL